MVDKQLPGSLLAALEGMAPQGGGRLPPLRLSEDDERWFAILWPFGLDGPDGVQSGDAIPGRVLDRMLPEWFKLAQLGEAHCVVLIQEILPGTVLEASAGRPQRYRLHPGAWRRDYGTFGHLGNTHTRGRACRQPFFIIKERERHDAFPFRLWGPRTCLG